MLDLRESSQMVDLTMSGEGRAPWCQREGTGVFHCMPCSRTACKLPTILHPSQEMHQEMHSHLVNSLDAIVGRE